MSPVLCYKALSIGYSLQVMNVEVNFTSLDVRFSLCLVCSLSPIRTHFRQIFGLVLFRGVPCPHKAKEGM